MGDLPRKDFEVAVQANLRKVLICDTKQDLEGKHGTGDYLQQQNKAFQNCCSMLNDDLLPPHVPKERQCYVNIYLFIALRDFLMPFQC